MQRTVFALVSFLLLVTPMHATMSRDQAKKLIAESGFPASGEGMLGVLIMSMEEAPRLIEAFLTLGIRADQPITYKTSDGETFTQYPLNYKLEFACEDDISKAMVKLLLDAGADPNTRNPENSRTVLMQAARCPDIFQLLLSRKPDLTLIDQNGDPVMYHVIAFGGERKLESMQLLLDAGFDIERWRKQLLKSTGGAKDVNALLNGKTATPKQPSAPGTQPKVDWKSLPPFPQRSAAEARKLLHRPGADTTIDEHMWDGITQREPLRLAMALAAGANVRQTRPVTGLTPLVLLAERCDNKDAEVLVANAELLIAAAADLRGVDSNGANALVLAADHCPLGVVQAMLKAGISPTAASRTGSTALRNAITDNRADVVAALLDAGVDPKKEPYNVKAAASGKKEIEALLKKRRK